MTDPKLEDKVVLVTGGGRNIGAAISRAFAAQGAKVAIHYLLADLDPPHISTDAARAFGGQIGYGSSKAAVEALTRSAALDLGGAGIRVNAVAPGPVQTGWMSDDLVASALPDIPLGRVGRPDDIADAVVFLASEQARWITGQILQVAGGHAL